MKGRPRPPRARARVEALAEPDAQMLPRQKGELLQAYVTARRSVDGVAFFDVSLVEASLCGADLRGALLSRSNFQRADLRGADLRGADLRGADLRSADLRGADLRGCSINLANLERTNLGLADLSGVDLSGVKGMQGADLRGADLSLVRIEPTMRGARVNEQTFYRSGWARPHLNRLRDSGVIFDGQDRLPLDLRPLGAPGCQLLTSPDVLLHTRTDATGAAKLTFTIANRSALVGVRFFDQFVVTDPTINPLGLVVSNGGAGKIGH